MTNIKYLGDSIYIGQNENMQVCIYLNNGDGPTNIIVIDDIEFVAQVIQYLAMLKR